MALKANHNRRKEMLFVTAQTPNIKTTAPNNMAFESTFQATLWKNMLN